MKLVYGIKERPRAGQLAAFALQQLLAIMAATIVVPMIVGNGMSPAAALLGAGVGTLVYILFTRAKSPVFLGSSFAFLDSMVAAFAGAATISVGYLGLIIGAILAGLVYVIIAIVVKFAGVHWISRLMPPVVIGPTVAIIGLSLAGSAVGDLTSGGLKVNNVSVASPLIAVLCGLVALGVTIACSTYGKRMTKLIPFVLGILAGYMLASVFSIIGYAADVDALKVIDYSALKNCFDPVSFTSFFDLPDFTFVEAMGGFDGFSASYFATIFAAYVPVAFVVFTEHIADHKNLSSIIGKDLLEDPGLTRTLLGDGIGSMAGAFFGGCPNTTYGESIACVAITRNASVYSIIAAACGAVVLAFFSPFVAFVESIPSCVMGGVCMALYGFIAVSGLKMLNGIDLGLNRNLFVVSVILIAGVGGLTLTFGAVMIRTTACALILGILVNLMMRKAPKEEGDTDEESDENKTQA